MPPSLFLDRIQQSAATHSARPAVSFGGDTASYADLLAAAHGIRNLIVDRAPGKVNRIGIVTGDDLHTYASLLATWSLGAAYVPLNAHSPSDRNARVIEQADLDVILTSRPPDKWSTHLPADCGRATVVPTVQFEPDPAPLQFAAFSPDDIAYILFTSGSTGTPKGVPISHRNLSAFVNTLLKENDYAYDENDRFMQMFELTFDLSIVCVLVPWAVGACCCVVSEKGIAYLNVVNTLKDDNITIAMMVPSILPYLQRYFDELRFPNVRLSQFCGEALMQDMALGWSQCVPNAKIENVYGPTEATVYCTRYNWDAGRAGRESVQGIVPIGKAIPGMRTFVVDANDQLADRGTQGELCLEGDQVMTGYWNDEATTSRSFVALSVDGKALSAYRTGDIAYENENGDLIFCGRKDSQVKIDGHRIELGEIEFFARSFIGHSAAAVIVAKDSSGLLRLKLFVGGDNIDQEGLDRYFKDNLPPYMWPSAIQVLRELPLNLNGKIDRPALKKL